MMMKMINGLAAIFFIVMMAISKTKNDTDSIITNGVVAIICTVAFYAQKGGEK